MRYLFLLCMDGHWFRGPGCPLDGWTFQGASLADQFFENDPNTTIDDLISSAAINDSDKHRLMIIESASLPDNLVAFAATDCHYRGAASSQEEWPSLS